MDSITTKSNKTETFVATLLSDLRGLNNHLEAVSSRIQNKLHKIYDLREEAKGCCDEKQKGEIEPDNFAYQVAKEINILRATESRLTIIEAHLDKII